MLNIAEAKIIEKLNGNIIEYDSWKKLHDYCFKTNNIKVVEAVINARVRCITLFEKNSYELNLNELNGYKSALINKQDNIIKKQH